MKQLTITLQIDPATAIRAGKSKVGDVTMTLSDDDLAKLTADQLDTLARHVEGERIDDVEPGASWDHKLTTGADPIAEFTIETLAKLLDIRRSKALPAAERIRKIQAERELRAQMTFNATIHRARNMSAAELADQNYSLQGFHSSTDGPWVSVGLLHKYAHKPIVDLVERREEIDAEFARRKEIREQKEEEAKRKSKAIAAAEQAQLEEILIAQSPDLLPVFRAERARKKDIKEALQAWFRVQLESVLGPIADVPQVGGPGAENNIDQNNDLALHPKQFAVLENLKIKLGLLPFQVQIDTASVYSWREAGEDEEGDIDGEVKVWGPPCAVLTTKLGGHQVKIETPLK